MFTLHNLIWIITIILVVFLCLYTIVDRICKCFEISITSIAFDNFIKHNNDKNKEDNNE